MSQGAVDEALAFVLGSSTTIVLLIAGAVFVLFVFKQFKQMFSGKANLPPMPVVADAATTKGKSKIPVREPVDLSLREPVVLYGTLTGTSKAFAQHFVREAKDQFDITFRIMALEDYELSNAL